MMSAIIVNFKSAATIAADDDAGRPMREEEKKIRCGRKWKIENDLDRNLYPDSELLVAAVVEIHNSTRDDETGDGEIRRIGIGNNRRSQSRSDRFLLLLLPPLLMMLFLLVMG